MRILFIARRFSYLKNFEGPILELAARGHDIHLVALFSEGKLEGTGLVQRWAQANPRISFERLEPPADNLLKTGFRARISMMLDYLRYLDPAYAGASGLIERARRRTPQGFLDLVERVPFRQASGRRALTWFLQRLEAAPRRRIELDAYLNRQAPDVVLFTPLISLQSEEQDLLTASVEQGRRAVFCVLSWDNLSSKAVLRTMPDMVTVWNDTQRDEARHLHGVPDERIAVTGAQTFDHWFNRQPSRSRAEFLTRVGLPPDRPFLLWVCSALFRSGPPEAGFVREWIEGVRRSRDPLLREMSILVRPHPTRLPEWEQVPLHDLPNVAMWGENPIDTDSRNDYFDSLYYSEAVVGLNTSAFLEAAIVGRPVYAPILPQFVDSQEGTLHFDYLLRVAGGLLHTARDLESHLRNLADGLKQPAEMSQRSQTFVEAFVRPRGMNVDATTLFVKAIEDLSNKPRLPALVPAAAGPVVRFVYRRLESFSRRPVAQMWLASPNEIEHARYKEEKLARASEGRRIKAERAAEKQQRRLARQQAHAEAKLAKEARRNERLRLKAVKEEA